MTDEPRDPIPIRHLPMGEVGGRRRYVPPTEPPDPPDPPRKSGVLSAAKVQELISDLAEQGDGADRRWALKMLSAQSSTAGLPEPISQREAEIRLGRLMFGYGEDITRRAMVRAFSPKMTASMSGGDDPSLFEDEEIIPTTLDEYWARWPHKRHPKYPSRYPPGYPYKGTAEEKKQWVVRASTNLIIYERNKAKRAAKEAE